MSNELKDYISLAELCQKHGLPLNLIGRLADCRKLNGWSKFIIKKGRFLFINEQEFIMWLFSKKRRGRHMERIHASTVVRLRKAITEHHKAPTPIKMDVAVSKSEPTIEELEMARKHLDNQIAAIRKADEQIKLRDAVSGLLWTIHESPCSFEDKLEKVKLLSEIAKDNLVGGRAITVSR